MQLPHESLTQALHGEKPLVADGATGTMLQQEGLSRGTAPERWTLENPGAIARLASGYLAAGSDIVYSNTFGGNRIRLHEAGLESRLEEVNRRAVEIARAEVEKCGRQAWLVASIGPTGQMLDPYGDLSGEEALDAFREQASILLSAGVDGFACETFTATEEAELCIRAVREIAPTHPVFGSMAFETNGRTMMGVRPEDAAVSLLAAGADVVGANCSVGPEVVLAALRAMRASCPDAKLLGKANAGLPRVEGETIFYPVGPDEMGAFAIEAATLGAVVIGGCCGTTPAHIRSIRHALDSR